MSDRILSLAVAGLALLFAAPATAEAPPRVRGVVIKVDVGSITVAKHDGGLVTLMTKPNTVYAEVVPSRLGAIKVSDFVGTAVKGPTSDTAMANAMVAVEMVIIPESMRSGRVSYYNWDRLPDPTARQAFETTVTSMTNGLVSNVVTTLRECTDPNVINDIVSPEHCCAAGITLTVTYGDGGKNFRIIVPANTPITRYVLADRSTVGIGSRVLIKTNPGNQAALVTVGKGITPPQ